MKLNQGENHRTDAELVGLIQQGDTGAFDILYSRYRGWVMALANRFTGNQDDALDVLQETFAYLLRKLPGLTLTARLTTFLYPAVKNLSLEARRKRRPGVAIHFDDLPAPAIPDNDPRAELFIVLQNLSPDHREVVLMRFVDDLSLEEIATALQIPTGTVKSRLHHAISLMRADPRIKQYFDR